MARKPRIHIPGGYYHVILRGNGGSNIFFSDEDRIRFYLLMQEGVERFGHRIHAFFLMDNHVHLVLQVGKISLSRIMQNLSFRYTIWINVRKKRAGHLFQGRFKALLVDADSYLLELVRYTHLNPVRAGMVNHPSAYQWNSHAVYLGEEMLPWLESHAVLSQFSERLHLARERYDAFINQGMHEAHRPEFHCGASDARVVGDDAFAQRVLANNDGDVGCSLDDCINAVCRCYKLPPSALSERNRMRKPSEARAVVAWLTRRHGTEMLSNVARRFGRDVATMSTAVRRLEEKMMKYPELRTMVADIESEIIK